MGRGDSREGAESPQISDFFYLSQPAANVSNFFARMVQVSDGFGDRSGCFGESKVAPAASKTLRPHG